MLPLYNHTYNDDNVLMTNDETAVCPCAFTLRVLYLGARGVSIDGLSSC